MVEFTDNPYNWYVCSSHEELPAWFTELEFEARGSTPGWIGKSGSDEGGNRPDQEGQQKHLSKEKLDWRGHLKHNSFWFFCSQC